MAQVSVKVIGREYDLTCGDGEEAHLRDLAHYVDAKATAVRGAGVNLGDAQLLLMTGIVIADELMDTKTAASHSDPVMTAKILDSAASRLEALTARLEAS